MDSKFLVSAKKLNFGGRAFVQKQLGLSMLPQNGGGAVRTDFLVQSIMNGLGLSFIGYYANN